MNKVTPLSREYLRNHLVLETNEYERVAQLRVINHSIETMGEYDRQGALCRRDIPHNRP